MFSRDCRSIFFRSNTENNVANSTSPRPPIWIRAMITNWPKVEKYVPVSTTTRPVTQEAEVAVKRASTKDSPAPSRPAKGSISSRAPARISPAKVRAISWEGEKCLIWFKAPPPYFRTISEEISFREAAPHISMVSASSAPSLSARSLAPSLPPP